MKIKTNEASGVVLDWMVVYIQTYKATDGKPVLTEDLMRRAVKNGMASPSTDWSQGGPIIEREKIGVWWDGVWHAKYDGCRPDQVQDAYTPLIAAMRCYVASKLGDELEIPNELIEE